METNPQKLNFVVIDTMTDKNFAGNPTPVIILDELKGWLSVNQMQLIAREFNHSETVFVRRVSPAKSHIYDIRWYTPFAEEPFCGHGALAAAIALHQAHGVCEFTFNTFHGITTAAKVIPTSQAQASRTDSTTVSMSFPSSPVSDGSELPENVRGDFAKALGLREMDIIALGRNGLMDVVVEVDPSIDFSANGAGRDIDPVVLMNASPPGTRSQVVTSAWNGDDFAFAKRVFAYGSEDQATGSTYCALAPYWAKKTSKLQMRAIQVSLRGGEATLVFHEKENLVDIVAKGVQSLKGTILVPTELARPKL